MSMPQRQTDRITEEYNMLPSSFRQSTMNQPSLQVHSLSAELSHQLQHTQTLCTCRPDARAMQLTANERKETKEMLLDPLLKLNVQGLDIDRNLIERLSGFILLGVHVSNNLSWNSHVDYICARANTRLHYLKRLKQAGLPANRLTHWYISAIRPVLEYSVVVWHHGLSKNQTELTEAIQRRALRIVYPTGPWHWSSDEYLFQQFLILLIRRIPCIGTVLNMWPDQGLIQT